MFVLWHLNDDSTNIYMRAYDVKRKNKRVRSQLPYTTMMQHEIPLRGAQTIYYTKEM
jgi:hypothetical protein